MAFATVSEARRTGVDEYASMQRLVSELYPYV